ncbi:hypothetical protein HHI36_017529 [Cryptolaemus montrouzieri]|uniref:HTH psq-type domain-containing protein n=1 Tax=Cryptolaemus montrouzieri TaxID=559131 RepID=A0ABD2NMS7_9CUCU
MRYARVPKLRYLILWYTKEQLSWMPPIKRKTWDHAAMIQAVNAVRRKEIGYLRAAKQFGVPKGTFERYVKRMSAQKILSRSQPLPQLQGKSNVDFFAAEVIDKTEDCQDIVTDVSLTQPLADPTGRKSNSSSGAAQQHRTRNKNVHMYQQLPQLQV